MSKVGRRNILAAAVIQVPRSRGHARTKNGRSPNWKAESSRRDLVDEDTVRRKLLLITCNLTSRLIARICVVVYEAGWIPAWNVVEGGEDLVARILLLRFAHQRR